MNRGHGRGRNQSPRSSYRPGGRSSPSTHNNKPVVLLEQGSIFTNSECLQDDQVLAMIIILGPKLKHVQDKVQEDVKNIMSELYQST